MIYFKNNEWHLCTEKVKYNQGGASLENYVGTEGKQWWTDFENKHKDMNIIEFLDVTSTDKQLARLQEVNELGVGDGFSDTLRGYIADGVFPNEANHILKDLENKLLKKEIEQLQTKLTLANQVADFQEELIVELAMQVY